MTELEEFKQKNRMLLKDLVEAKTEIAKKDLQIRRLENEIRQKNGKIKKLEMLAGSEVEKDGD